MERDGEINTETGGGGTHSYFRINNSDRLCDWILTGVTSLFETSLVFDKQ
jgi:hypothetical protein